MIILITIIVMVMTMIQYSDCFLHFVDIFGDGNGIEEGML